MNTMDTDTLWTREESDFAARLRDEDEVFFARLAEDRRCDACDGTGEVTVTVYAPGTAYGCSESWDTCPACRGLGEVL